MNSEKQAPNISTYQPQYEDEVSLVDIVRVLLRRKKIILGITLLVTCIGLIYAFTAKRVYQVETILLPPSFEDIQPLNVSGGGTKINSKTVFSSFIINTNSRKLRKEFFDKYKLLELFSSKPIQNLTDKNINDIFESFSKALKVKVDKKSKDTRIVFEGVYKEKLGDWLDSFVRMVNGETKDQLVRNLQANIDSKKIKIKINISTKRTIYKKRREDELGRLQEALQVAKNLGIHNYNNLNIHPSKNANLSIYMQDKKIYMQGTKVLQAEIKSLQNRKSDDIHIKGLRDLQEQLTQLEVIKIEKSKLQTVIVDKKAVVSVEPIRPKRKLIIILSIILGGMLGIFAIFIMEFISKLKSQTDSKLGMKT